MSKLALGLVVVAGMATSVLGSTIAFSPFASATFSGKDSVAAQGNASNALDSWTAGAGGSVTAIRVTGTLNAVISGTYASEARVRLTAGAGSAFTGFNYQASTTGAFTSPLSIGPTTIPVTPFSLTSGGAVNFEWFESYDDGVGADANWSTVTYEFGSSVLTNGSYSLGALPADGLTHSTAGSHVSGGLDFFTFDISAFGVPAGGGYLNISMNAGASGSMTDTEVALYDSAGNLVATDDDGGAGLFSMLSFGALDPLGAGANGLSLAPGAYTIVTGGYNTNFTPLIGGITAGTNAGSYSLDVTYIPTPGSLALLGLGGLVAGRRRR